MGANDVGIAKGADVPDSNGGDTPRCSFCAKHSDQVEKLIAGPGHVYICNECVGLCREILEEEGASAS